MKLTKKIVLVIWEDAAGDDETHKKGDCCDLIICSTVGFVVYKDKKMISISQDWQEQLDQHRNNISIPIKMIKKIIHLKYKGVRL